MTEQSMQNQNTRPVPEVGSVPEGQVEGTQPGLQQDVDMLGGEVHDQQVYDRQDMPTMQEGMQSGQGQNQQDLPAEAQNLPVDAQHIFQAAMSAAQRDGMSEEGAKEVAWNSVRHKYVEVNGEWQRKPEDINEHHKAVQNAGN